jgi:hypothetical protein
VLLKNTRDKQQFTHLARQVYPENSTSLYESHLDATEEAYGYLVLDFAQDTDDKLRYRTHIFPDEHPIQFYIPPIDGKSYETFQLPYSKHAYAGVPEAEKMYHFKL